MSDMITIEQAVSFGRTYGFSLLPVDGCDTGPILGFSNPTYALLRESGQLVGDFWKVDFDDDVLRKGICLVYCTDAQGDLLDYEPPESIVPFLSQAHLAEYMSDPVPTLRLISKAPLLEILTKQLKSIKSQKPGGVETPDPCRLEIKPYVKELLDKNPDFSGRTMVCDVVTIEMPCNEPCCHSEFAWSKAGTVLLYMYSSSDLITGAWFLPIIRILQ